MGVNLYTNNVGELPTLLPIIPVNDVILFPRSELQIPISKMIDLSSISEALKGDRFVGIVQSSNEKLDPFNSIFNCGCTGKVLDIQEIDDVGLILSIIGICRFEIKEELDFNQKYRNAIVSYEKYEADIVHEADFAFDRKRLISALKKYCKNLNIFPNWKEIEETSNEKLITMLMMICPFDLREKQTLLETVSYEEQSKIITSIIEMDNIPCNGCSSLYH